MLNDSKGPQAPNDQENTANNQVLTASTPPKAFPTHNPATQHKQFMGDPLAISNSSTKINNPVSIPTANPDSVKFPDPTKNLAKITSDVVESDAHQKNIESEGDSNSLIILGIGVLALAIIAVGMFFLLIA